MSSEAVSSVVFVVICGGIVVGHVLHDVLPRGQLTDDAKDVVRLGTGLIGTIAALVLGLLIASAKTSYDTQSSQLQRITADVIELDRLLALYGPETRMARESLRHAIGSIADGLWREDGAERARQATFEATDAGETTYAAIQELSAQSETQRLLKARAIEVLNDLTQTRLLLFARAGNSIPTPFLAILVLWLAIIFASFSLFSKLNPTLTIALLIFGLSASGAIFLILELSHPFAGLMQFSDAPLRNAVSTL
jgi:hypothetical protein